MIPHNRPTLGPLEVDSTRRVIESGWLAQGPEVAAFEDEMCAYLGLAPGHAVAVSSGSAALFLALLAADARGKPVAAPAYSCRALWNAIDLVGARAEWIDTAAGTPHPSLSAWVSCKAHIVIVAHMYGIPAPIPEATSKVVIEDCAQALGAEAGGAKIGTRGFAGVFSFGATKPITSGGQGGMVVSRNATVVDFLRRSRDYDTPPDRRLRFNFQMTDLQAAIGRIQLGRLPEFMARRDALFKRYADAGLPLHNSCEQSVRPFRFRAVVKTSAAQDLINALAAEQVRAIVPVTVEELLASPDSVPNAASLSTHSVSLPLYPSLSDEQADRITEICSRMIR